MSTDSVEKIFKCEYFDVFEYIDNKKVPFDLEKWIKGIDVSKYSQNAVEYLDDYIRVEAISYEKSFDFNVEKMFNRCKLSTSLILKRIFETCCASLTFLKALKSIFLSSLILLSVKVL